MWLPLLFILSLRKFLQHFSFAPFLAFEAALEAPEASVVAGVS